MSWAQPLRNRCMLFGRKMTVFIAALPAMEKFKPEFVLISAGFDSHRDDPHGGLALTADDYCKLTRLVCDLADHYGEGRVVSVLEGGYNLKALAESVVAHMQEMANESLLHRRLRILDWFLFLDLCVSREIDIRIY